MNEVQFNKIQKDLFKEFEIQLTQKNIKIMRSIFEKNNLIEKEKNKDYECKGQMNIYDYPEYLPNNYDEMER